MSRMAGLKHIRVTILRLAARRWMGSRFPPSEPEETAAMKVNLLTRERLSLLCWALIITYIILAVYHLGDFGPNTGGIKNSDYVLLWSASNLARTTRPRGRLQRPRSCVGSKPPSGTICTKSSRGSIPRPSSCSSCPWASCPTSCPWPAGSAAPCWGALAVLRRIAPDPLTRKLALAFPGNALNLFYSQGIFLLIGLMGGGLLAVDGYPLLAGLLLGLSISYKPHLGFLLLVALVAGRRWQALGAMLATVAGLAGLSAVVFGLNIWVLFWQTIPLASHIVATVAELWPRMSTPFAAVRLLGGGLPVAWIIQGIVSATVAVIVFWVWRQEAPLAVRASTLVLGALLATPYALEYDLALLSLPLAWMAWEGQVHGWRPGEKYWLPVVWVEPHPGGSAGQKTGIAPGTVNPGGFPVPGGPPGPALEADRPGPPGRLPLPVIGNLQPGQMSAGAGQSAQPVPLRKSLPAPP